jgi:hypothetical protein
MKIITRYHRPSTNVAWWTDIIPPYVKEHYQKTYIDTGMRLSEEFEISEDGLTMSHIAYWIEDENVMFAFLRDPIVAEWKKIREEYCNSVNITKEESEMIYDSTP